VLPLDWRLRDKVGGSSLAITDRSRAYDTELAAKSIASWIASGGGDRRPAANWSVHPSERSLRARGAAADADRRR